MTACGSSQKPATLNSTTVNTSGSMSAATSASASVSATPTDSPSTPAAPPSSNVPAAVLPADLKFQVDGQPPSDPVQKAVWDGWFAEYQAEFQAITRQDSNDSLYKLWTGTEKNAGFDATASTQKFIAAFIANGHSVSGTLRLYNWTVTATDSIGYHLSWCEDQTKFYDKDIKTGKVLLTSPSRSDFYFYRSTLQKGPDGRWITNWIQSSRGDSRCT